MLNKKELEQTLGFLSIITDCARELLDEVATYEALLRDNKLEQRAQSELRKIRKKRARFRSKTSN